ncbi:MAG: TraB/TrbI/VirB10 family type IV secretion system protein [Acidobacteriaceae bacterium]
MKAIRISAFVLIAGATALAQSATQSDPYQGVSHPPQNDVITTSVQEAVTPTSPKPSAAKPAVVVPNPPATDAVTASSGNTYGLQRREPVAVASNNSDPDAEIVTSVPSGPNELPEGTVFKARINETLSTNTTVPGTPFSALLIDDVQKNGRIVIPSGSKIIGRVVEVSEGRRIHGKASIRLRPDEVVLPDGSRYMLHAQVIDSDTHNTRTDSEGTIQSRDHTARTAAAIGLMTGGAAVAGAEIAGGVGALVGAGIGAGIGTTQWLLQNRQATLTKDSELDLMLTEPMQLAPIRN